MVSLWRENKAQSYQRRAEISKQICFLRLKEEKKLFLIFLFKWLNPFRSWFPIYPPWLTAGLEISHLQTEHSCRDLQVEKTFLNMVSNVLTCWWNGCYITSKGAEKSPPESRLSRNLRSWNLRSSLNRCEFKILADGSPSQHVSTIPSTVPAPLCSNARFHLSGWRSERWDVLLRWSTCQGSEFWRLVWVLMT